MMDAMGEADVARRLAEAALGLLEELEADQRERAQRPFDEAERRDWTYLPGARTGLALAEMERHQAKAAHRLLAAGLCLPAYAQVTTIIGLEDVLDELQGGRKGRHAGDYWTTVFGDPGGDAPWGWRFEGHHVSVNYTIAGDRLAATPLFLGANPAVVDRAGTPVLAPLHREEDLGRALLEALDETQRARAVISDEAPPDIVTGDRPEVGGPVEPLGVSGADLGGEAAELLHGLAATYLGRLPEEVARPRLGRLEEAGVAALHFAWAGDVAPGGPHYYRVQGPRFVAELDNTQDGANHVHTVCRDPDDDFGDDLLSSHYAADHP